MVEQYYDRALRRRCGVIYFPHVTLFPSACFWFQFSFLDFSPLLFSTSHLHCFLISFISISFLPFLHFILGKGGRDSVGLIYLGICLKFCSRQMQNVFRVHRTSVTWLFNKIRFVKIVGDRSKSVPFSNFYFKTKSNLMILLW